MFWDKSRECSCCFLGVENLWNRALVLPPYPDSWMGSLALPDDICKEVIKVQNEAVLCDINDWKMSTLSLIYKTC